MGKVYNQHIQNDFRKKLRNEPTKAEFILWQELKGSKLGYKFRRQHGVGAYVIDFYCPALRLAIEVDGDTHFEPVDVERDMIRTRFITERNIQLVRVNNVDVYESIDGVIELIQQQFPEG
ncbi:endonuclease domain-containing protein [Candidatus Uhrbacteria bacterium]|nr:endonuclease domain-containing protein [Candidatus Uhrbacteria bacterium]